MALPTDIQRTKAARELLGWNQGELASATGLSIATVKRYEAGHAVASTTVEAIASALTGSGIVFLSDARIGDVEIAVGIALRAAGREGRRSTRS